MSIHKIVFAALLSFAASASLAQQAYLVKDINTTANDEIDSSSYPAEFFRFGSRVFFSASTLDTGTELWVTDGTPSGTSMIADLLRGRPSSHPSQFTVVNGNLLFDARDTTGEELWVTDGTTEGTRVLIDIAPAGASAAPGERIVHNGRMLFSAEDGVHGRELWITDGTAAGTRLLKDLAPGTEASHPRSFVLFNGTIYFFAANAMWKSDGTEAGTVIVKRSVDGSHAVVVGSSHMFFRGHTPDEGNELWISDGTESGTYRVMDILPGPIGSLNSGAPLTPLGNRVLFAANAGRHSQDWWVSDGTEAGTHMLSEFTYGVPNPGVIVLGGTALFSAGSIEAGEELWKTDGTSAGTVLLRDLNPGPRSSVPRNFVELNGAVYFTATRDYVGQLWVTDGTVNGTRLVISETTKFSVGSQIRNLDGTLYFSAANALNGQEPWKSDGTAGGTVMIANIEIDPAPSSRPSNLRAADDWIYFRAWDGTDPTSNESTVWRTDGTSQGTVELPIAGDAFPSFIVGRSMYFPVYDSLWMTDGTPESTKPAADLKQRLPHGSELSHVSGTTLFVINAFGLWSLSLAPGSPAQYLGEHGGQNFVDVAGRVFFFNSRASSALYTSDGTPAGTRFIRTTPGNGLSPKVMGGRVFFKIYLDETRLWSSDGTVDGTAALNLPQGGDNFQPAGTKLFFQANGKLWVTDGTQDGTRELPATFGEERTMAVAGSTLIFASNVGDSGTEVWASDGTPEGTRLLADLHPGGGSSRPHTFTSAGGNVYFVATTDGIGEELWVTDGTATGTRLAADIEPGSIGSSPGNLIAAGDRLYFTARTSATGTELWAIPLPSSRLTVPDVRMTEADAMARFTITLSSPSTQAVTVEYATANGTAAQGSDFDAATGTITFAPGETTKHLDVHVREDATSEIDETFFITFCNPAGATLETATATAIVEDDDRTAELSLALNFNFLSARVARVEMKNAGPSSATGLKLQLNATPFEFSSFCSECRHMILTPNGEAQTFGHSSGNEQQYVTATITAAEHDPNPANNTFSWTMHKSIAMDAHTLTPGSQANIWVDRFQGEPSVTIQSSDPSVVSVPSSINVPGSDAVSFVARALAVGKATIRVSSANQELGFLEVEVLPPGAKKRWSGAFNAVLYESMYFHQKGAVQIETRAIAPGTNQSATGEVIVTADGVEVGRGTLTADKHVWAIPFRIPEPGDRAMTIQYAGDANFLPQTRSWTLSVFRSLPTLEATASRNANGVIVRARISGLLRDTPTGSLSIVVPGGSTTVVPIEPHGPGRAFAEWTLTGDLPPFLTVGYNGDSHYRPVDVAVQISDERRRGVRH